MPAVSDSSPLILYSRIGRLELLRDLFEEVLVPPAVWSEVVVDGAHRRGTREVASASWIRARALSHRVNLIPAQQLDPGEFESIALAAELRIDGPVILDDMQARRAALRLGLFVVGSAGVLNFARRQSLIPSVRPILEELRFAGLYLSDAASRRVLERAGES